MEKKATDVRHNAKGEEVLDPTPMQPPLGYKRAPTLAEQIRQQVLAARLDALNEMEETEEEADDFEVGDDFEPYSKHENEHMPSLAQLKEQAKRINENIRKANIAARKKEVEEELAKKRGEAAPPKAEEKQPQE